MRCGGCGSRLCVTHTRNRWDTLYVYFFCLGRQQRRTNCVRKAVPVEVVEERVEELWTSVNLSPEYVELITQLVRQELTEYREQAARTRATATRRLEVLQNERRKLLQAHYADAVPVELLKSEQDRITAEVSICERQLAGAGATEDATDARLQLCLSLVTDAARTYARATPTVRRRMNQALLECIEVGEDGDVTGQLAGRIGSCLTRRSLLQPRMPNRARSRKARLFRATRRHGPSDCSPMLGTTGRRRRCRPGALKKS